VSYQPAASSPVVLLSCSLLILTWRGGGKAKVEEACSTGSPVHGAVCTVQCAGCRVQSAEAPPAPNHKALRLEEGRVEGIGLGASKHVWYRPSPGV
jgi:hypothetical protein